VPTHPAGEGDAQLVWPPADDDPDHDPGPVRPAGESIERSSPPPPPTPISADRRRFDALYLAVAALALVATIQGIVIYRTSSLGLAPAAATQPPAPVSGPLNGTGAAAAPSGGQSPVEATEDAAPPAPAATAGSEASSPPLRRRAGPALTGPALIRPVPPAERPAERPAVIPDAPRGASEARTPPPDGSAPTGPGPGADPRPAAVPPAPAAVREGILHVNALPWAEVWIDGQPAGETPLGGVRLPAGRHVIRFVHPTFGERTREVTVVADESARVGIDLRP
jgi:hypothetical protein